VTREDHGPLADTLIRLYADAQQAEHKRSMAFELGDYDRRLLRFAGLFRARLHGPERGHGDRARRSTRAGRRSASASTRPRSDPSRLVQKYCRGRARPSAGDHATRGRNLSELHRLRRRLVAIERRLLPSLDLRRRQIAACLYEERREAAAARSRSPTCARP